jgi:flagellar basal body rod protein FlgB
MDLTPPLPDNLSELLMKIVQFTASRRTVLYQNIREMRCPGFVPQDLPVFEFVHAMNGAIAEHVLSQRLMFRDTENIKFGQNGLMTVSPVVDTHAEGLLAVDTNDYLEHQVDRLLENSLNRKVAENLLRLKSEVVSASNHFYTSQTQTSNDPFDAPSPPGESEQ